MNPTQQKFTLFLRINITKQNGELISTEARDGVLIPDIGPQPHCDLDKKLIADVALFDLYAGEGVGEGKKSLAIAVRLEPSDRTLTDAEIETLATKLVDNVKKLTGGELRG